MTNKMVDVAVKALSMSHSSSHETLANCWKKVKRLAKEKNAIEGVTDESEGSFILRCYASLAKSLSRAIIDTLQQEKVAVFSDKEMERAEQLLATCPVMVTGLTPMIAEVVDICNVEGVVVEKSDV